MGCEARRGDKMRARRDVWAHAAAKPDAPVSRRRERRARLVALHAHDGRAGAGLGEALRKAGRHMRR